MMRGRIVMNVVTIEEVMSMFINVTSHFQLRELSTLYTISVAEISKCFIRLFIGSTS